MNEHRNLKVVTNKDNLPIGSERCPHLYSAWRYCKLKLERGESPGNCKLEKCDELDPAIEIIILSIKNQTPYILQHNN